MVVHNFNVPGVIAALFKTDPPLVIDADAVLPKPITAQLFKAIGRRTAQVQQVRRRVKRVEPAQRGVANGFAPGQGALIVEQFFRVRALEAPNHRGMLTEKVTTSRRPAVRRDWFASSWR